MSIESVCLEESVWIFLTEGEKLRLNLLFFFAKWLIFLVAVIMYEFVSMNQRFHLFDGVESRVYCVFEIFPW